MSVESQSRDNSCHPRLIGDGEKRLLLALFKRAGIAFPDSWAETILVVPIGDKGMGGLKLPPLYPERNMKERVAEIRFQDLDGVDIIASLNVDLNGSPLELDIWKVNFKPVLNIPDDLGID